MLLGFFVLLMILIVLLIGIIAVVGHLCMEDDSSLEEQCFELLNLLEQATNEIDSFLYNTVLLYDVTQENIWKNKYSGLLNDTCQNKIKKYKKCSNYNNLIVKKNEFHKKMNSLKNNIVCHNLWVLAKNNGISIENNVIFNDYYGQYCLAVRIINIAISEIETYFQNRDEYITELTIQKWKYKYVFLLNDSHRENFSYLKSVQNYSELIKLYEHFHYYVSMMVEKVDKHNSAVLQFKIKKAYELIGAVEGATLDEQQMKSIVIDAYNHLVIAGAGTGKTTTIVGKIKYLLAKEKYRPEDILVLSFTNSSASEMCERIKRETNCNITAHTFHKLGLDIITKTEGKVPIITQLNLQKYIKKQLDNNIKKESYLKLLNCYLLYHRFVNIGEENDISYEEYLRWNPPTTVCGETVKSYGEMDIANFLIQHGIEYRYEQSYEIDTRSEEYAQYYPDFYLPEYKIYIEYFGINRAGEVPQYFKSSHGETAQISYLKSIEWKRITHKENHTDLIECFAYERVEGNLLTNLEDKLRSRGVRLEERNVEELWNIVVEKDNSLIDGIVELFETLINLMKSNNYTIHQLKELTENKKSNKILVELLEPIYESYCVYLKDNNEIDFNDMINKATQYVEKGMFINPYKYVIIDEYQDISKARFNLMKSLRKSADYNLFCVGDDWQSIYRFAGSDISYIIDFDKYWGITEKSKIETTYRFNQQLINVSSFFVMQNPKQIRKFIVSKANDANFALDIIEGYTEQYAMQFMLDELEELPKGSSVYFIGRYSFDVKIMDGMEGISIHYDNTNGQYTVNYERRRDLKMQFLTAHKSKGLQADYVFIINNKNTKIGFPSKIQDSPLISILLNRCENYPYSEERRLFYVALTRARKKVYLVIAKGKESEFAKELTNRYADELKKAQRACPICGGMLIKKSGPYGEFLGCSNYKSKGCTYKRKIN